MDEDIDREDEVEEKAGDVSVEETEEEDSVEVSDDEDVGPVAAELAENEVKVCELLGIELEPATVDNTKVPEVLPAGVGAAVETPLAAV